VEIAHEVYLFVSISGCVAYDSCGEPGTSNVASKDKSARTQPERNKNAFLMRCRPWFMTLPWFAGHWWGAGETLALLEITSVDFDQKDTQEQDTSVDRIV